MELLPRVLQGCLLRATQTDDRVRCGLRSQGRTHETTMDRIAHMPTCIAVMSSHARWAPCGWAVIRDVTTDVTRPHDYAHGHLRPAMLMLFYHACTSLLMADGIGLLIDGHPREPA